MNDFNLKQFNKWFMDNIADEDGDYNKPIYEAAKWAWEEQQEKLLEQQNKIDKISDILSADVYHIPTLIKDLKEVLDGSK